MKKRLWMFGVLLSSLMLYMGCSADMHGTSDAESVTQESSKSGPAVRRYQIGLDDTFIPMEFRDVEGSLVGYDIDLASAVMQKAGLQYVFRTINWEKKEDLLLHDRKIDMIWSALHITPERKSRMAFSDPYLRTKYHVVVPVESSIRTRADLEGKVVGYTVAGAESSSLQRRELPGGIRVAKAEGYAELSLAMAEMLAGKVDAVIGAHQPMFFYHANTPGKFRILDDIFIELDMGVAVRPDEAALLQKINQALAELQADGTVKRIHDRWFPAAG